MKGKHELHIRNRNGLASLSRGLRHACMGLLVLVAGAGLTLAMARQSAGPNIQLEVHDHASNGSDGFTNTTASNGATYSYRYSGGEGSGGDVIFRSRGRVTFNVNLANGEEYEIDDVSFIGDVHQQLSWLSGGEASSHAVIQDKNDQVQSARYKVTVRESSGEVTVPCDPKVVNQG